MTELQPYRPTRQPRNWRITPAEKLEFAMGDMVATALEATMVLAVTVARERFKGDEFQRLDRAHVLLADAVAHALERARRGRI